MRKLVIEDDDGKVKMELGTSRGRPMIELKGDDGESRVRLWMTIEDCPMLVMSRAGGQAHVTLGIPKDGRPVATSTTGDGTRYRYAAERIGVGSGVGAR